MCLNANASCGDPTSPGVWWRDDADWKQYDAAQAATIQKGIADGAARVDVGTVVSSKYSSGARYVVELSTMKQINLTTGFSRDVKVVKAPPATPVTSPTADDHHTSIKEELRACQKSMRSLKNMVLRLESDLLAVRLQLLDKKPSELPLPSPPPTNRLVPHHAVLQVACLSTPVARGAAPGTSGSTCRRMIFEECRLRMIRGWLALYRLNHPALTINFSFFGIFKFFCFALQRKVQLYEEP